MALPAAALDAICQMPRFASDPRVFARLPSHYDKSRFDRMTGVTGWSIHDLRKTARSLMSRIGIPHEVAEAVLGHTIPGVAGIYNRHSYETEKGIALTKLAATISQIVDPTDNVVVMEAV